MTAIKAYRKSPRGWALPGSLTPPPPGGFQTLRPAGPPACIEYEDVIGRHEDELAKAWVEGLPLAADDAAEICAGCPVQAECLACAETEKYTGIAGGRVLNKGAVKA